MDIVNGLTSIGVLTICLGLYRVSNGRLASVERKVDSNVEKKVDTKECHYAQDNIKAHIDTRIEDLKEFIKNGHK